MTLAKASLHRDLRDTISQLGEVADVVGDLFNTFEDCTYECKPGEKLVKRRDYVSKGNGCGSYGITVEIELYPGVTDCCNVHDKCYDKCGVDKAKCDAAVKECMEKYCLTLSSSEAQTDCSSLGKIGYGSTAMLGCTAFQEAQKTACVCHNNSKSCHNKNNNNNEADCGS